MWDEIPVISDLCLCVQRGMRARQWACSFSRSMPGSSTWPTYPTGRRMTSLLSPSFLRVFLALPWPQFRNAARQKGRKAKHSTSVFQGFQVPSLPAACRKEFAQGTSAPPQQVQKRTKLVPDPPILVGRANWSNAPSTSTARSAQTAAYMARKKKKPA